MITSAQTLRRLSVFGIVKKASIVTTPKALTDLVTAYVDETSKWSHRSVQEALGLFGEHGYLDAILRGEAPLRPGVDFIPTAGSSVRVFGHLRHGLDRRFQNPDSVPLRQMLSALEEGWMNQLSRGKVKKGYHIIFSMNPAISSALADAGVAVDDVLFANAAKAFEIYAARFYPGENIGWVGGVHHDTANPHLHALVFPLTSGGKGLHMSRFEPVKAADGSKYRVDFQGTLVNAFFEQCKETALGLAGDLAPDESTEEAADHVLHLFAATAFAHRATKDKRPTTRDWRAAWDKTKEMPPGTIADYQKSLPASMTSGRDAFLERRRIENARLMREIFEQTRRIRLSFQAAVRRRSEGGGPLYKCGALGWSVGYPLNRAATSDAPSVLEVLRKESAARADAYRDALGALHRSRREDNWLPDLFARASQNRAAADTAISLGQGRTPTFLAPGDRTVTFHDAKSAELTISERFAAALSRNRHELRPFTREEFANRDMSPYRRSKTGPQSSHLPTPTDVADEPPAEYVPTPGITPFPALGSDQLPPPTLDLEP